MQNAIDPLNSHAISWSANVVLTRRNIETYADTYNMLVKRGVKRINTMPLNIISTSTKDIAEFLPSFSQIDDYYDQVFSPSSTEEKRIDLDYSIWHGCGAASREFAVDSYGNLFPCRLMMDPGWNAGLLDGTNFASVWENSKLLSEIRESQPESATCLGCIYYKHCRGGCLAINSTPDGLQTANNDYSCHWIRVNYAKVIAHRTRQNYLKKR